MSTLLLTEACQRPLHHQTRRRCQLLTTISACAPPTVPQDAAGWCTWCARPPCSRALAAHVPGGGNRGHHPAAHPRLLPRPQTIADLIDQAWQGPGLLRHRAQLFRRCPRGRASESASMSKAKKKSLALQAPAAWGPTATLLGASSCSTPASWAATPRPTPSGGG